MLSGLSSYLFGGTAELQHDGSVTSTDNTDWVLIENPGNSTLLHFTVSWQLRCLCRQ